MNALYDLFAANTPPPWAWLAGGPPALAWSYLCLRLAAYLKCEKGLRTGYTRKTYHVLIFMTAVAAQAVWGLPGVFVLGSAVTLVLAYAVARGAGHPLYEAIAREQDAPRRTYYVVVPYFATLLGGLASNLLFGPVSIFGYLVGGVGDAAGEPAGARWGRHRYPAPSFTGVKTTRSVEGSVAVLLGSLAALVAGLAVSPQLGVSARTLAPLPAVAAACALVEAVSPHGWDNATMQLAPSALVSALL